MVIQTEERIFDPTVYDAVPLPLLGPNFNVAHSARAHGVHRQTLRQH